MGADKPKIKKEDNKSKKPLSPFVIGTISLLVVVASFESIPVSERCVGVP